MLARLSLVALVAAGAVLGSPVVPARANDTAAGAIIGGAAGALIGGAVSGSAGGAVAGAVVGGTAGAIIGNQSDKNKKKGSYYFWSGGKCFYHYPNGQVVKVSKSYC